MHVEGRIPEEIAEEAARTHEATQTCSCIDNIATHFLYHHIFGCTHSEDEGYTG